MLKLYLCISVHFMLYIYRHDDSSAFIYIKWYLSRLNLFIMSIRVRVTTVRIFVWLGSFY